MAQNKLVSGLEAAVNTSSAILLSLISYQFILGPLMGFEVTWEDNLYLTGYFTILSFARNLVWRRWFTTHINEFLAKWFPDAPIR